MMTTVDNLQSFSEPVSDLVESFLDTISSIDSSELSPDGSFYATLMHEVDSAISDYLDDNNLASLDYVDLHQHFINTVAQELISETSNDDTFSELNSDECGNYVIDDVFAALETYSSYHIDLPLSNDSLNELFYDSD